MLVSGPCFFTVLLARLANTFCRTYSLSFASNHCICAACMNKCCQCAHSALAATDHGVTSDRLTMLGPRPVIASLSLGATRTFRLRCMAAQDTQPHAATQQQEHGQAVTSSQSQHADCSATHKSSSRPSMQPISQVNIESHQTQQQQDTRSSNSPEASGNLASAQSAVQPGGVCASAQHKRAAIAQQLQQAGRVSSIDVVLPHNTLVIMWPPMQEAWKHEVKDPLPE